MGSPYGARIICPYKTHMGLGHVGCSALIDSLAGKKGSLRQAGMECKGMGGLGGTGRREGGEEKGRGGKRGKA